MCSEQGSYFNEINLKDDQKREQKIEKSKGANVSFSRSVQGLS